MNLDVPTHPVELLFEVFGLVRDLDDAVGRSVAKPALDDRQSSPSMSSSTAR